MVGRKVSIGNATLCGDRLEGERAALLTYTWILTVGYLHLLTCTCVLTLILALDNFHLDTYTCSLTLGYWHLDACSWRFAYLHWYLHLLTYTWILAVAPSHLDASHFLRVHHLCTPTRFPTHTNSFSNSFPLTFPLYMGKNGFGPIVV